MSRTDLLSDVFTMIRNAILAKKKTVDVPSSKMVASVLGILKREEYIENYKLITDNKQGVARVYLRYLANKSAIRTLKRISRPSLRVYSNSKEMRPVLRSRGLAIVSTSKGVITDKEAREANIGGEILAHVW